MKATTKRKSVEPTSLLQDGQDLPSKKGRTDTPKAQPSRPTAIDKTSEKQRSLFERWCTTLKPATVDALKAEAQPEVGPTEAQSASERPSTVLASAEVATQSGSRAVLPITIEDAETDVDLAGKQSGQKESSAPQVAAQSTSERPISTVLTTTEVATQSGLAVLPITIEDTETDVDLAGKQSGQKESSAPQVATPSVPVGSTSTLEAVFDAVINASGQNVDDNPQVTKKPRAPRKKRQSVPKATGTPTVGTPSQLEQSNTPVPTLTDVNANLNSNTSAKKSDSKPKGPQKRVKKDKAVKADVPANTNEAEVPVNADVPSVMDVSVEPTELDAKADIQNTDINAEPVGATASTTSAAPATPVSTGQAEKRTSVGRPRKSPPPVEPDPKSVAKAAAVQQMSSFMKRFFVQADTVDKPPARVEAVEDDTNRSQVHGEVAVVAGERFKPFQLKRDMRLAPLRRVEAHGVNRTLLDSLFDSSAPSITRDQLYLAQLKTGLLVPRRCGPTWPPAEPGSVPASGPKSDPETDVEIVDTDTVEEPDLLVLGSEAEASVCAIQRPSTQTDEADAARCRPKCKLLQFHDNYRPAYFGTFRKRSALIRPRRPLAKDTVALNYELDSDEEWGSEPDGESVSSSSERAPDAAGDEPGERSEDYELDEFFVPHGYLSADEQHESGDDSQPADPDTAADQVDGPGVTPAMRKAVEQITARQLAAQQRRAATRSLRPLLVGCLFFSDRRDEALAKLAGLSERLRRVFVPLAKPQLGFTSCGAHILFDPAAYELERLERATAKSRPSTVEDPAPQPTSRRKEPPEDDRDATPQQRLATFAFERYLNAGRLVPFPDSAMPFLVKLLHGSERSLAKMVSEFRLFWLYRTLHDDATQHRAASDSSVAKPEAEDTEKEKDRTAGALLSKRQIELKANMIATYAKTSEARKRCWAVAENVRLANPGFEQLDLTVPAEFAALYTEKLNAAQPPTPRQRLSNSAASPAQTDATICPPPKPSPSPSTTLPHAQNPDTPKGTTPPVLTFSTNDTSALRKTIKPVRVVLENLKRNSLPSPKPVSKPTASPVASPSALTNGIKVNATPTAASNATSTPTPPQKQRRIQLTTVKKSDSAATLLPSVLTARASPSQLDSVDRDATGEQPR